MRKKLIAAGILLLFILLYCCLVCLPYYWQEEASEKTKKSFQLADFYGEQPCGERARILYDNEEALAARIQLISNASRRIILSTFDFRADNSGAKVIAALYDAAKRGVEVQILVDGFSYFNSMQREAYFQALGQLETVTIRVYNPLCLLRPAKLMARLHDKYLIADDSAYILGGRNTYDYFLGEETNYKNYDWDVLILSEDHSPLPSLKPLEAYFTSVWNLEDCKTRLDAPSPFPFPNQKSREAAEELEALYQTMKQSKKDWFHPPAPMEDTAKVNRITLLSNPIEPRRKEPVLFYQMTELMQTAPGDVTFHTPYVLCSDDMLERLKKICSADKEVHMMTNSVANNGNPFGAADYKLHKKDILQTGVKILEYDQGTSYHGKCAVIGDRLTLLGSFNWDMRSAYIDTELMLVIDSPELNQQMQKYMSAYQEDALAVAGEDTYRLKPGQTPQSLSRKRALRINLLTPVDPLLRFLF